MPSSERIVFIDLLRGWAGLVMIEVHVFNAFIVPSLKDTGWYHVLNFVNGLVAPAFLFVAGLVFVIVSERKLDDFRGHGTAFWKQLARIGLIWVIGYGLHLPFFSLGRTVSETTAAGWLKFFQVDILHCIALGLLVMFTARLFFQQRRSFQSFLWVLTAVFVLAAPFLWETDFAVFLHPALAAYINGQHFSQFPLFPWLGFMLAGGLVGVRYMDCRDSGSIDSFVRSIIWLGCVLVAIYFLIDLPLRVPYASIAIRANPLFVALRMGIILLLLAICWWYAVKRETKRSFVLDVSRETLMVYTAHLLLIYGMFWNDRSLSGIYGGLLSPWECVLATLGLTVVMIAAAKLWGVVKQKSRSTARIIALASGLVVTFLFVVR